MSSHVFYYNTGIREGEEIGIDLEIKHCSGTLTLLTPVTNDFISFVKLTVPALTTPALTVFRQLKKYGIKKPK